MNDVRPDAWPSDPGEERSALGACILGQAAEAIRLLERDDFSIAANCEMAAGHRRSNPQGLVNPREIVMHCMDGDHCRMVLNLL